MPYFKNHEYNTLKLEEDEECHLVHGFLRVIDLVEEAVMCIASETVVAICSDGGKGVRYISGSDDHAGLADVQGQQQEREQDAPDVDPFANVEGNLGSDTSGPVL